jgi:hypothetical protein
VVRGHTTFANHSEFLLAHSLPKSRWVSVLQPISKSKKPSSTLFIRSLNNLVNRNNHAQKNSLAMPRLQIVLNNPNEHNIYPTNQNPITALKTQFIETWPATNALLRHSIHLLNYHTLPETNPIQALVTTTFKSPKGFHGARYRLAQTAETPEKAPTDTLVLRSPPILKAIGRGLWAWNTTQRENRYHGDETKWPESRLHTRRCVPKTLTSHSGVTESGDRVRSLLTVRAPDCELPADDSGIQGPPHRD